MPIQTRVLRPEARNIIRTGLTSQSKAVRNYAIQLKSRVISDDHRKAVLKEMQRELTAQHYYRPEKRSIQTAVNVGNDYVSDYSVAERVIQSSTQNKIQTAVNSYGVSFRNTAEPSAENIRGSGGSYNDFFYYQNYISQQKNGNGIKTAVNKRELQTQRNSDFIQTANAVLPEDVSAVKTEAKRMEEQFEKEHSDFYRNAVVDAMVLQTARRKNTRFKVYKNNSAQVYLRAVGLKERHLSNKKYVAANADTDNSYALESAEIVRNTADTAIQTGGFIRTAVRNAARGVEGIQTLAKNGTKVGKAKDAGRIATAVSGGVKNIVSDAGRQLLKTKIDKSKITDTGTEAIKQGLTDIRYADNARKAVLNTARTSVKAGYAVKNMPKNTRLQMQRIRKNAERVRKAAEKVASVIKKILTSKTGLIVIGIALLLIILTMFFGSLVNAIVAAITALFSFLFSEDEDKDVKDVLDGYKTVIIEYIEDTRQDIADIVDGFVCDKRQYPPYDEITELNQYGNKEIDDVDATSVIAILAVLRYRELIEEGDEDKELELEFTDEEIQAVVDKFFTFEYYYTYGHCGPPYCKKKVTVTVYNEGTESEYSVETTEYYCDVDHQWLHGEVTNHSLEEVMAEYEFTDEEKDLYEMYYAQIEELSGGNEEDA